MEPHPLLSRFMFRCQDSSVYSGTEGYRWSMPSTLPKALIRVSLDLPFLFAFVLTVCVLKTENCPPCRDASIDARVCYSYDDSEFCTN